MVRDIDAIDAVFDGDGGVLGRRDALQNQRDVVLVLEALHIVPAERHLPIVAGPVDAARAAGGQVPLDNVPLAPGIMGGVDRDAEGAEAGVDGALHMVVDERVVAADVKLEERRLIDRAGDRLQVGLRYGAHHVVDAERLRSARGRDAAAGREALQAADRRQEDRQAEGPAHEAATHADRRDIAADARPEGQTVERQAVAKVGGFRLRRARQIVPGGVGQVDPRPLGQFLQGQEFGGLVAGGAQLGAGLAGHVVSSLSSVVRVLADRGLERGRLEQCRQMRNSVRRDHVVRRSARRSCSWNMARVA